MNAIRSDHSLKLDILLTHLNVLSYLFKIGNYNYNRSIILYTKGLIYYIVSIILFENYRNPILVYSINQFAQEIIYNIF